MTLIAVYAPMKPPDHPTPSGDREVARLTLRALEAAGFAPRVASRLRVRDGAGDAGVQARLMVEAEREVQRILMRRDARPALWFTYHSYYKAPDLLGPPLAGEMGIPYVILEPSHAPARAEGPWAAFAAAGRAAIEAADVLYVSTPRDRGALAALGHPGLRDLPPFLDPGPSPGRPGQGQLRLLTVAMMRPGEKHQSYVRLAAALAYLPGAWTLTVVGDGAVRDEVEGLFAPIADRVAFLGRVEGAALRALYEAHDLLVWPGVGEGFGMVYLEAQAAGLPVLAEDHPGPRAVIAPGPLPPPGDAAAFAAAIPARVGQREAARGHVLARHSLDAAAARLRADLGGLIGR